MYPSPVPNEALCNRLISDVDNYAPDCETSVVVNEHMNDYDGKVPLEKLKVNFWLRTFVSLFTYDYRGGAKVGDVVMGMVEKAKSFRTEPCAWVESDQTTRDAVIVDFINYVAGQQGMDLALYTVDIRSPESRFDRELAV